MDLKVAVLATNTGKTRPCLNKVLDESICIYILHQGKETIVQRTPLPDEEPNTTGRAHDPLLLWRGTK